MGTLTVRKSKEGDFKSTVGLCLYKCLSIIMHSCFNGDGSLAKAQLLILKQIFAIFTLMGINHLWKVPVPLSMV